MTHDLVIGAAFGFLVGVAVVLLLVWLDGRRRGRALVEVEPIQLGSVLDDGASPLDATLPRPRRSIVERMNRDIREGK